MLSKNFQILKKKAEVFLSFSIFKTFKVCSNLSIHKFFEKCLLLNFIKKLSNCSKFELLIGSKEEQKEPQKTLKTV